MAVTQEELLAKLAALSIKGDIYTHPAVFTVEEQVSSTLANASFARSATAESVKRDFSVNLSATVATALDSGCILFYVCPLRSAVHAGLLFVPLTPCFCVFDKA